MIGGGLADVEAIIVRGLAWPLGRRLSRWVRFLRFAMEPIAEFPTTRWSLVARVNGDPQETRKAIDQLVQAYQPVLRRYLVRRGFQPADADDLLSGFVSDKILKAGLLGHANARRGKLRTFLLTSLNNYVKSEIRKARAKKRSVGGPNLDGDALEHALAPDSPVDSFDVDWARQLLRLVIERTREACCRHGKEPHWKLFEMRVLEPIQSGSEPLEFAAAARDAGFGSAVQASNALITVRRTFLRVLRSTIAEYALDDEIDEEIADLIRLLGHPGAGILS